MTKLRFIIGVLFIFLLVGLSFLVAGNSIALIVDIASFVLVIIAPYILISLIYSPREQIRMTGEILSGSDSVDTALLNQALSYLGSLRSIIIVSGVLWTLLGTIGILINLADPQALGPNFSVALITIIYALIYILAVIEPLRASAEKKLDR